MARKAKDQTDETSDKLEENFAFNPFNLDEENAVGLPLVSPAENRQSTNAMDREKVPLAKASGINKEEELVRRERELQERERVLREQTAQLKLLGAAVGKMPNWPICYPFIHHDIEEDIPEEYRSVVRGLYYFWYSFLSTLWINAVATLLILMSGAQNITTGGTDFGFAIVYAIVLVPLSFFTWYRSAYNAYVPLKSIYFFLFFGFFGCHTLFCAYMAIGIPGSGSGGLINMLSMFAASKSAAAAMLVISTICWIGSFVASLIFFKWVHLHYKNRGLSLEAAKQEAPGFGLVMRSLFSG